MRRPAPTYANESVVAIVTVAVLISPGCTAAHLPRTESVRAGRVYCLRGLLDVFSLGLNDLSDDLRCRGVRAEAVSGPSWPGLARQLETDYTVGRCRDPLVLIGHSYGADDAVRVAEQLRRKNIKVDLLVLLDATAPPSVPANVERCVHLYRDSTLGDLFPSVFAGNPVEPEPGNSRTRMVNERLTVGRHGAQAAAVHHFNIDASEFVHDRVLREVLQTCPLRRPPGHDPRLGTTRTASRSGPS